jgi:hypothetical protein
VQTRLRTVITLLTFAGIAGIWLALAPFVASYQAAGDPWITATTHHVVTGAALIAVSLTSVLTVIGTALRALGAQAGDPVEPADVA